MNPVYWDWLYAIITACVTSAIFWVALVVVLTALYLFVLATGFPVFSLLTIKEADRANSEPSARFWAAGYMLSMGTMVFGPPVLGFLVSIFASVVVGIFTMFYILA